MPFSAPDFLSLGRRSTKTIQFSPPASAPSRLRSPSVPRRRDEEATRVLDGEAERTRRRKGDSAGQGLGRGREVSGAGLGAEWGRGRGGAKAEAGGGSGGTGEGPGRVRDGAGRLWAGNSGRGGRGYGREGGALLPAPGRQPSLGARVAAGEAAGARDEGAPRGMRAPALLTCCCCCCWLLVPVSDRDPHARALPQRRDPSAEGTWTQTCLPRVGVRFGFGFGLGLGLGSCRVRI